jgi:tetratricopeptide (TPR) repeat protein
MAPNRTFLQISLAWMLEKSGDLEQAKEYYRNIYCSNPGFQDASIFQTSSLYQTILQKGCPEDFPRSAFTDLIWAGHQALENGDFAAAEEYYQAAIPLNLESGIPYALMALVHQESGQIQEIDKDLQTAFLIEGNTAVNHEIAGRIALAEGELNKGYQHLFEAYMLHQRNDFSKRYYAYTYFDSGLPTAISPFVPYLISHESKELYEQLAAFLADHGEEEKSRRVNKWLEVIKIP